MASKQTSRLATRVTVCLAALAFSVVVSPKARIAIKSSASSTALTFAHVTALAVWFGAMFWVTFIAGIVMFKNLPRHTFGFIQSKLFPRYFQLGTLCHAVMVVTAWSGTDGMPNAKYFGSLVAGLAAVLLNLLVLEPLTTSCMFERHRVEKEQGRADKDPRENPTPELSALNKRFGMLHGISSLLNLASLATAIFQMWTITGPTLSLP